MALIPATVINVKIKKKERREADYKNVITTSTGNFEGYYVLALILLITLLTKELDILEVVVAGRSH